MDSNKIRSFEEYKNYKKLNQKPRLEFEKLLIKEFKENKQDFLLGFCNVCDKASKFKLRKNKKGQIGFLESIVCEYCGINNRKRFMLNLIKELANDSDYVLKVFAYEQITKFFKTAKKIPNIDLQGSEFLGYDKKPGQIINKIRNEDAAHLSFPDDSFDIIVSNAVFEHIPDIHKVLSEAHRCLKNSGMLLISIPFVRNKAKTIRRAVLEEGKIKNILPPNYHANPADVKKGSLVFYDYGWDFLDFIKQAGFKDGYMLAYYDVLYGHIGNGLQFIFVAEK